MAPAADRRLTRLLVNVTVDRSLWPVHLVLGADATVVTDRAESLVHLVLGPFTFICLFIKRTCREVFSPPQTAVKTCRELVGHVLMGVLLKLFLASVYLTLACSCSWTLKPYRKLKLLPITILMHGSFQKCKVSEFPSTSISPLQALISARNHLEGPFLEWRIKQCLYYTDGTPKRGPNLPESKTPRYRRRQQVKVSLDQYSDYHNLCKDLAHELKDLVSFQWIYEEYKNYYHFDFTTKTEADDGNLFFAELSQMKTEDAWAVSCCCMIEPNDDGIPYFYSTLKLLTCYWYK
ncbi:hypothetical protein BAE44_0015423 [Dichanthelium oligosanthes]|uniref:DUF3615 domain-containing protein n=1 Tax=Dichanthelium oligosanthes TaxID=888268 RepID=A0A1E5VEI5_9POAL|nr:hypothetical protein BAE44_0015423 [Dichanthelium oligosanthes]